MRYYKRLRVRRILWTLFPAILLWLAAAALVLAAVPSLLKFLFPTSIRSAPAWDLEGAYVEYDVPYIYTRYEREEKTPEEGSAAVGAAYLIDVQRGVNSYYFLSLYANSDVLPLCEALCEASQSSDDPAPVAVRGTITALEGEARDRYEEAVGRVIEALAAGEEDEETREKVALELRTHVKPLCLNTGMVGGWTLVALRRVLILAAVLVFLGLAPLIRGLCTGALTGRDLRQIREKFDELGGDEELAEEIADFYYETAPIGGVRVGRDFILLPGPMLLRPWDVAWAYYREGRGGRFCVLRTMDGGGMELKLRGKVIWELLEELHERCPGIIVGYTDEIAVMYEENRAIFRTSWESERPGCLRNGY